MPVTCRLDFDLQAGREQRGHRPTLVLSPATFYRASGLSIVCPITSRVRPFRSSVVLPPGLPVAGEVLSAHVRSIDARARRVAYAAARVPPGVLGIRIALGAGWQRVVATIARRAAVQLGVGATAGMGLAWTLLAFLKAGTGFSQTSIDSPLFMALVTTVSAVSLVDALACIAPTLRALRIAPAETLSEA